MMRAQPLPPPSATPISIEAADGKLLVSGSLDIRSLGDAEELLKVSRGKVISDVGCCRRDKRDQGRPDRVTAGPSPRRRPK
jgi:hypothetical protein